MTKRIHSLTIGALAGTFLLYALVRDYVSFVSTGRSLWWLALELLIVAAFFASFVLLGKVLPEVDLEAIKGVRAVAGVAIVLAAFVPAIAGGIYLDGLLGFELSVGVMLGVLAMDVALRFAGQFLSSGVPSAPGSSQTAEPLGIPSSPTPPN